MSSPALRLSYFNAWGRGGAIRVALRAAGIDFTDTRITFAELKAQPPSLDTYPLGQVPVMAVDGKVFTQSGALLRYAGRKSGLYPSDAYDALRVDEVVCVIDDVAASAPQDPDAAIKKAKREAWVTEKLPKYLNLLEARLADSASAGPYVLGAALSIADLAVFGLVHSVKSGSYDYVAADSLDKWAHVVSLYAALKAHPLVAAEFPAK